MFILIMGVTGSGKTTVGTLLASAMGWPFYDADDFHSAGNVRKMASGVPLTDDDRAPWLKELHELICRGNERGENGVLACSALKETYRRTLGANTEVAAVFLKADRDLIRSRLERRSGHYMPQGLMESQFRDLEEPQDCVVIDGAWPPEQIVRSVRCQIGR